MASNQQDLPQESTLQPERQSISPIMNSPGRPAPELPNYNSNTQATSRPPRSQYGRMPGTTEGEWPLVATAAHSPSSNAAPTQQTAYTPQPYRDALSQSATPLQYQQARVSADTQTRAAMPQQYEGRARASSNQQLPRPASNNMASPPPPHFYDGRNDVLGSGPYPRMSNAPGRVPIGRVPLPYNEISKSISSPRSPQLDQQGYQNQSNSQPLWPGSGQALYQGEQSHQNHGSPVSPQLDQQTLQSQLANQAETSYQRQPTSQGQPAYYSQEITQRAEHIPPTDHDQQIRRLPGPGGQTHQTQPISSSSQVYQNQHMHQDQPGYSKQSTYHGQAAFPSQPTYPAQEIQQGKSSNQAKPKEQVRLDGKGKLTSIDEQTRLAQQKNRGRHGFEGRHSHEVRQSYEAEKNYEAEPNLAGRRHSEEQHRRISSQTTKSQQGQQVPQDSENRESQQGGLFNEASQTLDGERRPLNVRPHQEQDTQRMNQVTLKHQGRQNFEGKQRDSHQQALTGLQNGKAQQSRLPNRALHNDQNYERRDEQFSHDAQERHLPTKPETIKATGHMGAATHISKATPHDQSKYPSSATNLTTVQSKGPGMAPMPFVAPKAVPASRSTSQPPGPRSVSQPNLQPHKLHKSSQPNLLKPQQDGSPDLSPNSSPKLRGRDRNISNSAIPTIGDVRTHDDSNRPSSYHSDAGSSDGRSGRRRSWIPGSRSRHASEDMTALMNGPPAWVVGGPDKVSYDIQPLRNGEMVPELWDDSANVFVYLFPPESRRGPSFKIRSAIISSSYMLRKLAFSDSQANSRRRAKSFDGRNNLSVNDARLANTRNSNTPPHTPAMAPQDNQTSSDGSAEYLDSLGDQAREGHLFYPFDFSRAGQTLEQIAQGEHDHFVSARNLFAFLTCRPLIATRNCQTVFSILSNIGNDLSRLEFSNADGSTYGEAVATSLSFYVDNLGLADVRNSREKTLEGIVLGERLRSVELYNEAFTHAVGKYETIMEFSSPLWDMITSNTRNRLERAFMDLTQRQHSVLRLADFEFPSLFAGYAASTSTAASKVVRFRSWKSSFLALRRHILSYYKDLYGDWPPKAKSKKNQFSISGLNRLVLKALYADFCTLYDLLVDRESLTTRSMDIEDILFNEEENLASIAMRKILTEYDRSSPPVQPPVPFDLPKIPSMAILNARHNELPSKSLQQAESRKLQGNETLLLLAKSHNLDSDRRTPFLQAFQSFEEKEARGRNSLELADQRYGYWLFIYVVLQALPMVVIDAPGLKFAQGIEYFLCQPPKGGIPWVEDAMAMQKTWYGVDGSSKVVALPSDIVHHSVEAIYQRSHCWIAAGKWLDAGHGPTDPEEEQHSPVLATDGRVGAPFIPLVPPPEEENGSQHHPTIQVTEGMYDSAASASASDQDTLRPLPQGGRRRARSASNHRKSIAFGLEQLPVPQGYNVNSLLIPDGSPRHSPPLGAQQQATSFGLGINDRGRSRLSNYESGDEQGKSFDDILNAVQSDKEKRKKESGMRRKSFMGF